MSGAHYSIEDQTYSYEVRYWILEFIGEEDIGYDYRDITVEATDEKEAIRLAKEEAPRGAKKFEVIKTSFKYEKRTYGDSI